MATASDTKVTLSHVAEEAGVSPSTVSRILNGTARVNPEKEARVREVIARLGFKPDPAARALAGGRTSTIGVVTQFIDSPFYGEALRGVEDELQKSHQVPLFVSGHWDEGDELAAIEVLRQRKVDGVIALSSCLSDETLTRVSEDVPLVVTGRRLTKPNVVSIDYDNVGGSHLAVAHLRALGHQNIAFIAGPMTHADARERLAGYVAALGAEASRDSRLVVQADYQEQGGFDAMNQLLDSGAPFTAVLVANDQMAYGARLALYRRGIALPEAISLVGFDDLYWSRYAIPPLTTVHHSAYDLGASAAKAMMDLIGGQSRVYPILEASLIVRETTASPQI